MGENSIGTYKVKQLNYPPKVDARWKKSPWDKISPVTLTNWMGAKPQHFPKTQVKMAYDEAAIYGIFKVEDQ
jgi:hypothetical protein